MLAGLLMKPAAVAAESARSFRQQNGLMAYACYRAGVGLTAMKIQGGGPLQSYSESALEMAGRFMQKGSTDHQAKLIAVWEDKRIAGICSQMPNLTIFWLLSPAPLLESVDRIYFDFEQSCDVVFGFDALGMAASGGDESDLVILPYLSHHHFVD